MCKKRTHKHTHTHARAYIHSYVYTHELTYIARDEIIRIREEKKEDEARIAAMEEAERIWQHDKDVLRIQVEADRIRLQETSMSREMND